MDTIETLLSSSCPLPFVFRGGVFDGTSRKQLKICRDRCDAKECGALGGRPFGHNICSKGFSCYPIGTNQHAIVLNGLLSVELNKNFSGERRKIYKANAVTESEVGSVAKHLNTITTIFQDAERQGAKDSVAFFHDVRTSVGVVLSWCQEVIAASPGTKFEEKLATAKTSTRNLFDAINLLQEQLELADIIANPAAITYGRRGFSSLVGFWYKMVKLFEARAARRDVDIKFNAHGREIFVEAYNSFQFVPLILLDNAIKYSFRGKTIFVEIDQGTDRVSVAVNSFGKTVPREYWERIFLKNVRGPNGIEENPEGMGMGLFLANEIVGAHDFALRYEPPVPEVNVGNNRFIVDIPVAKVRIGGEG